MQGLKHNWSETNKLYSKLPLIVDSVVKIKKKERIEATLTALEKNITMLEENPCVYVFDDGVAMEKRSMIRRMERGI